jgi:hypothetical protein
MKLPAINASRSRRAVQISIETWLIGRNVDASKKIFMTTEILLFDFELFICERAQKDEDLTNLSNCCLLLMRNQDSNRILWSSVCRQLFLNGARRFNSSNQLCTQIN